MKPAYRTLRIQQLTRSLAPYRSARSQQRPTRGWLRALREALGLSLAQVGRAARLTRQDVLAFENSEARDRITLQNLKKIAEAMGCELVYGIVPKSGTLAQLAEAPARRQASERVLAVEHTMALEGQAAGRVKEKIEEETRRVLKKRRK